MIHPEPFSMWERRGQALKARETAREGHIGTGRQKETRRQKERHRGAERETETETRGRTEEGDWESMGGLLVLLHFKCNPIS